MPFPILPLVIAGIAALGLVAIASGGGPAPGTGEPPGGAAANLPPAPGGPSSVSAMGTAVNEAGKVVLWRVYKQRVSLGRLGAAWIYKWDIIWPDRRHQIREEGFSTGAAATANLEETLRVSGFRVNQWLPKAQWY